MAEENWTKIPVTISDGARKDHKKTDAGPEGTKPTLSEVVEERHRKLLEDTESKIAQIDSVRRAIDKYPDLAEHSDRWGTKRLYSKSANRSVTDCTICHNCGCCSDSPLCSPSDLGAFPCADRTRSHTSHCLTARPIANSDTGSGTHFGIVHS